MQLSPLPGHVFVEYIDPVELRGSLVIPDSVKREERNTGRVVASADYRPIPTDCCPGCCPNFKEGMDRAPMDTKIGEYVMFKLRSADVISIKGRMFFNVHEDDILMTTDSLEDFQKLSPVTT